MLKINKNKLIERIEKLRDQHNAEVAEFEDASKAYIRDALESALEDLDKDEKRFKTLLVPDGIWLQCTKISRPPTMPRRYLPSTYDADIEYLELLNEREIPAESSRFEHYLP